MKSVITPNCPRCGSEKTGYYIFVHNRFDIAKIIAKGMERGELIRVSVGFRDADLPNLFCEDCGIEWRGSYETKRLSETELAELKEKKDIDSREIKELNNSKRNAKRNKRARRGFLIKSQINSLFKRKK